MNKDYMELKNVIPIFNFNYSINMLFRCSETKYCRTFINGEIHFSQPKIWIDQGKKGNNTQGDKLEGTFLTTSKNDTSDFIKKLKKDEEIEYIEEDGLLHFRKKSINQCYSVCFYGLKDNSFVEKNIDDKGIAHYYAKVGRDYFSGFSEIKSREEYEKVSENEKSSVVFIYNPSLFFLRIKNKLIKDFGLNENEIIISPVEYVDKRKKHMSIIPYPLELLMKDKKYEKQSEIRIIINTKNSKFIDYMQKNNGNINIGSIENISHIYDYYFNDLLIENTQKNEYIFNLPIPELEPIEDMTISQILRSLYQIRQEDGDKWVKGDKYELIKYLEELIKEKFGVLINYDEKGNISITNANDKVIEMFKKENYKMIKEKDFNEKIDKLINDKLYSEAILEMKKEANNKIHEDSINYYIAKIYEKMMDYPKAIEGYSKCIDKKMRKADALSSRINCYNKLQLYDKAIEDLNSLQELIGYNHHIYSNIGVNYINLGKINKAISFFNKSIEINPINAYAYFNRGVAYYKINNFEQFEMDVKKALELEPNNKYYKDTYKRFRKT